MSRSTQKPLATVSYASGSMLPDATVDPQLPRVHELLAEFAADLGSHVGRRKDAVRDWTQRNFRRLSRKNASIHLQPLKNKLRMVNQRATDWVDTVKEEVELRTQPVTRFLRFWAFAVEIYGGYKVRNMWWVQGSECIVGTHIMMQSHPFPSPSPSRDPFALPLH